MRKSKQFVSMPVISLAEGQQIGSIKGLVINPVQKAVTALIIEQKGWFKEEKYIPFSKVRSIGEDALTIDRKSNAEKSASIPEIVDLLKDRTEISGAKLITEDGTALGYVDEYYVDLQSGDIVGLEFSGGSISSWMRGSAFLDINHVLTIGKKVIVCSNAALENIIKMDGGLQEALRGLRDSTGSILSTTVQKTKELGSNINKTLEKVKRDRIEKQDDDNDTPPETPCRTGASSENCHCCNCNDQSPVAIAPAENEIKSQGEEKTEVQGEEKETSSVGSMEQPEDNPAAHKNTP